MTAPAILAYARTGDIVTTSNGGSLAADLVNNVAYIGYGGTGGATAAGVVKFNGYTADTDLLEHNCSDIGGGLTNVWIGTPAQFSLSRNGYLVLNASASNWPAYWIVEAATLTFHAKFGTDSAGGTPGPSAIGSPANFAPLRFGTTSPVDFMVITASRTVNALPVPDPGANGNNYLGQVDEHAANCGPGAIAATGTAFVLGTTVQNTTTPLGLYKISASGAGVSMAKIGTVSPAQIDATWSTIYQAGGCAYDQTDGNVLIMVHTGDAVTNKIYIVKLSHVDASVIWTCPVAFYGSDVPADFPRANIATGTFYFMVGGDLYSIDTSTGVGTLTTYGNLQLTGPQVSDDVSQSLMLKGTWSETTTHPTYLGSYMGAPGNNHTTSKMWMRFFPGGVPPAPPTTFTLRRATAQSRAGSFQASAPLPTKPITIIPSYLYQQYNDDDDMQAFVGAQNSIAQAMADWFTSLHLPVYTADPISGTLLDWVAKGLYGTARPALGSGSGQVGVGPLNTWPANTIPLNTLVLGNSSSNVLVSDDVFRRILTWHLEKDYGRTFNIRWLKRRVIQFINGANGVPFNVDQTYAVSVTFGVGGQVDINFPKVRLDALAGAIPNTFACNTTAPNERVVSSTPLTPVAYAAILRAGIASGALELPFQFTYIVNG